MIIPRYATTDLPIRFLPRLGALWNATIFPRIAAAFGEALALDPARITARDVFVVKHGRATQPHAISTGLKANLVI